MTLSLPSFISLSIRSASSEDPQEASTRDDSHEHPQSSSPRPSDNTSPSSPSSPQLPDQHPTIPKSETKNPDTIHLLLQNPVLCDPIRTPRFPIVLCHGTFFPHSVSERPTYMYESAGLYGFDVKGPASFPSLRMHYWSNVLSTLQKKIGVDVIVTSVPGCVSFQSCSECPRTFIRLLYRLIRLHHVRTGSIFSRATILDQQLQSKARGRGINFLAHSMGGLDCRHLISHIKPTEYTPLSLTTISTPHRGSPFMDWCVVRFVFHLPRCRISNFNMVS
jgi:triacylglycerol lipase